MAAESGKEKRGTSFRLRSLLVFLLILAAVSALLRLERFRRLKDIDRGQEMFAALVRSRPVEQTMAQRARYYRVQYYLGYPGSVSSAVAGLSRRLCAIFGPGRILNLKIDPGLRDLHFELAVGIRAKADLAGAGKALEAFASRYLELGDFTDLFDLSFTKKEQTDGNLHTFIVAGQAELP